MIIELGDGRELELPDEIEDESARQIGRLILALEERAAKAEATASKLTQALEKRAADAEATASRLQMQIDNLRAGFTPAQSAPVSDADAEGRHTEVISLLNRLVRIGSADRILVYDDLGSPRSRIAL